MSRSNKIFAAIEAGGTKVLCALAAADGSILSQTRIPTRGPAETLDAIKAFYEEQTEVFGHPISAGIASFGPIDLDRTSPGYGRLTTTPKAGWSDFDLLGAIQTSLGVPTAIDTDVNCAALAEGAAGAAAGLSRYCYMTVGTGIGVGIVEGGKTSQGTGHPEVGHIRLSRARGDDFAGICPYHGDCAEGLASGPAMKARWEKSAEDLEIGHPAWEIEAHYIAAICANLTYSQRPERIIIGGGVLERSTLYNRIRVHFEELTRGYALDQFSRDAETYIARPQLVDPSPGLVGALQLAQTIDHAG
ncbi:ROK family protein [Sphingopyxis sp. R3-92]|uniref:ROK family protein n=1 Tax=Sphingopyxis sp. R3-92 TaxID=3158553 RepID=UPI003EE81BF8